MTMHNTIHMECLFIAFLNHKDKDLASDPSAHLFGRAIVIRDRQKTTILDHFRPFWPF